MPKVVFEGRNLTVEAQPEETLLSCIRRAGFAVESTCDGRGACGKCRVAARGDLAPADDEENAHLVGQAADIRLACMARVLGTVGVSLSDDWTQLKSVFGPELREIAPDSTIKRLALPEIERSNPRPYAEFIALRTTDPRVLNKLAIRAQKKDPAFGVICDDEILDVRFNCDSLLGVAVDVGTTSLSLYVFDLESGKLLGKSSALNPQTAYGGDVITRISYCRESPEGVATLAAAVLTELGAMLEEALGPELSRDRVYLVTVAGNMTMLHLLAGVYPLSLGLAPFRPAFLKSLILTGEESGLPINPQGRVIFLPGVSAYIGADITAGLMAIGYRERTKTTLFIDIGTNGEMVLVERPDRMLATSCAVGPALEGMNISCGCRAVPGAIDTFSLDETLAPILTTIGGISPRGICGSGLIDLVAALVKSGLITESGAFNPAADSRLAARMKDDRYHLTDTIFFTQKDVRQVQLAKGAVVTGIEMLLEEAGRSVEDLQEIIVAGSFGYHSNPENLIAIGFLPKEFQGLISFAGNSSLSGASLALLNREMLRDMKRISENVRVVELSSHPDFSSRFISNLQF